MSPNNKGTYRRESGGIQVYQQDLNGSGGASAFGRKSGSYVHGMGTPERKDYYGHGNREAMMATPYSNLSQTKLNNEFLNERASAAKF